MGSIASNDMGHDHEHHRVSHPVSRRAALAGIGSIGLGTLLAACTGGTAGGPVTVTTTAGTAVGITPQSPPAAGDLFAGANTCALTPATTPGPFYFDSELIRADIREGRPGSQLAVAIKVQDSQTCRPLPGAVVELWHCDADGRYSGAEASSGGGDAPPRADGTGDLIPQDTTRYLRGTQVTGAEGVVRFTTIWPGSYGGRTVHIHAMVHFSDERVLTTQLMFDDDLSTEVFRREPYAGRAGSRTFNDDDSIFRQPMLLKVVPDGDGHLGTIVFSADSDMNGS